MHITKTNFLTFLRCPKAFWLDRFEAHYAAPPDTSAQRRLRMGQEVDRQARAAFPDGTHIPYRPNPTDQAALTGQAIADGATALFQATFVVNKLLIKADILTRTPNGWHLIEVKSSTSVKPEHLPDVAFQHYVLEQAGLDVAQVSLMHLNRECRAPDLTHLFVLNDVTRESAELQPAIAASITNMRRTLVDTAAPDQAIGQHCSKPYQCPFTALCWRDIDGLTIFDIPRLGAAKTDRLQANGVIRLQDIPPANELTAKQQAFVDFIIDEQVNIDKPAIQAALDQLTYPLYFFDFETIDYALPVYAGCNPYQQVPFQYSCHILHENGTLAHDAFVYNGKDDPRPDLIEALRNCIGERGSVIVYYAPFERARLREMADAFPQSADQLRDIADRLWDQLDIFKQHYRHYGFGKSNSLKSVLPVVVPELSYAVLDVQNGTEAQVVWEQMVLEGDSAEKERLLRQLLAYCELDTLAMVRMHTVLTTL